MDAVQLGFVRTTAPDGSPVVLGLRGGLAEYGGPSCEMRVLAVDRSTATAVRDEVARLAHLHDPFRGQVLSFDVNEHEGNEMVPSPLRPGPRVALPGRGRGRAGGGGGFLALVAGAMGQTIEKAGTVWCGERAMSPGDSCVTIGGAGGTKTYEQVLATQGWQESVSTDWRPILLTVMWIGLGVGALLFVVGIIRFYRTSPPPGRPG